MPSIIRTGNCSKCNCNSTVWRWYTLWIQQIPTVLRWEFQRVPRATNALCSTRWRIWHSQTDLILSLVWGSSQRLTKWSGQKKARSAEVYILPDAGAGVLRHCGRQPRCLAGFLRFFKVSWRFLKVSWRFLKVNSKQRWYMLVSSQHWNKHFFWSSAVSRSVLIRRVYTGKKMLLTITMMKPPALT